MSQLTISRRTHFGRTAASVDRDFCGALVMALAAVLVVIGVIMVFSTLSDLDAPFWPRDPLHSPALRQAVFAMAAVLAMWSSSRLGHVLLRWRSMTGGRWDWLLQPAVILVIISLLCLAAALVPALADERKGARRWLYLGYGLSFQPSELAKLSVLMCLAVWLPVIGKRLREFWSGFLPPVLLIAACAVLIGVEDVGTAALIVVVGGLLLLAAGARWWHAAIVALPGIAGFAAMILSRSYRWKRLISFRDIWDDPLGSDYHAIQSLIAIAGGGWRGAGIGAGTQKFGYLPEAHNDFVFAVLCEEMGLLGGLAVIGLFACLCLAGWRIMVRARDPRGKLLALGITTMIGLQAVMNIAVVTVMVPTKGISLPLVSAGGSGLILYGIAIGLLASVGKSDHPTVTQHR